MMILVEKKDIPQLTKVLFYPFQYNLSVNRYIKSDKKKMARIAHLIEYVAKLSIKNQWAYMNTKETAAVMCLPSEGKNSTWLQRMSFYRKVSGFTLGYQLIKRKRYIARYHPSTPFCHLLCLGVDITSQRQGEGSLLLKGILNKCLQENLPLYVETANPNTLRFYQKNGFHLYDSVEVPGDGFTLHLLKWTPNGF